MVELGSAHSSNLRMEVQQRVCVFAHYDRDDLVDDYVYYLLECLLQHVCLIEFVSTANLSGPDIDRLQSMGINVTIRPNVGHDFCSYKVGLGKVNLNDAQELVLCNDSVYGPLFPLSALFDHFSEVDCDFWGISTSDEIARHVQSYFMVFRRRTIESSEFSEFWLEVTALKSKSDIVETYEVGLSRRLASRGLRMAALIEPEGGNAGGRFFSSLPSYCRVIGRGLMRASFYRKVARLVLQRGGVKLNPLQYQWRANILQAKVPLFKVELLRDNPLGISDRESVLGVIEGHTDYPTSLISAHLARLSKQKN